MNEFLACALGLARQFVLEGGIGLDEQLQHIQCNLIDVGSALASMSVDSSSRESKAILFDEDANQLSSLESLIDVIDAKVPPLTNFILPGGGRASCQLHLARSVCRRAERAVVAIANENAFPLLVGNEPTASAESCRYRSSST
eukprot:m.267556 g.267556  ORF g.267556 m.267556 type:complete len:143 (+) comp54718_c0_seq7:186-614(+)